MNRPDTHTVVWFLGLAIVIGLSQPASALRKNQPWGVTTRAEPDTHAGGWFINLGITGARAKILRDAPGILEVTYAVWYKDGGRSKPSYADMGRTGASALAHYLSPIGGRAYSDFAKLNANCIGNHPKTFPDTHGSPLLGMVWTALGALPSPVMFRKLMDYNRWHFALAQCPDGTFYYQPNRDNNPQDFAADPRLCASAVTALILSVKHRRLQMTGAKLVLVPK